MLEKLRISFTFLLFLIFFLLLGRVLNSPAIAALGEVVAPLAALLLFLRGRSRGEE